MLIKAIAKDRVKIGDEVNVEIDSILMIKAILVVYLLPAIALLAGVFVGLSIVSLLGVYNYKEGFSILTGSIFLGATLLFARKYGIKKKNSYRARVTKIIRD
jgi:sigma-E factor negative regulatory protein RseC